MVEYKEDKMANFVNPVSISSTKKILDQMINCVCKIKTINGGVSTGFFCKVNSMNFLMTCNHVLNEEYIKNNKELNLSLNNDKKLIKLDLRIQREIYSNKEYDTTFIELKEEDEVKNYLELDDNLFQVDEKDYYKDQSIYDLQYIEGAEIYVSYGLIIKINKYEINLFSDIHSCGSPILNLKNNKVIGIGNHSTRDKRYGKGIFLKYPLNDFRKKGFKIIKELGQGGFGKVNKIFSKLDNKYFAMKEIPLKGETEEKINNIKREANILSKFNSNLIVKYYDSYEEEENFYILMEYCDRKNLKDFLDEYKKKDILLEENIICNIIKQICLGIKNIHEKKIVHRDLKPENIFMNENMEIKIGDFGIAKQLSSYSTQINKNKGGSLYYTAPEIFDKGLYNIKSDMWSLGCILYEIFTLNTYFIDNFKREIKKIDNNIYNNRWQELINLLLQIDYNKRLDIGQVCYMVGKEISKDIINNNNKENKIICEIYINKNDLNKDVQIINSFENIKRGNKWKNKENDYKYENERELKENTKIKINGKLIEFAYYYKFTREGKYKIEYSFQKNLKNINHMFYGCDKLTSLNLSNFNTQNVTNMEHMFDNCSSLAKHNLITKDNKILNAFEKKK